MQSDITNQQPPNANDSITYMLEDSPGLPKMHGAHIIICCRTECAERHLNEGELMGPTASLGDEKVWVERRLLVHHHLTLSHAVNALQDYTYGAYFSSYFNNKCSIYSMQREIKSVTQN